MGDDLSDLRDMILALSDRAEELGESAAATELRSVSFDVASGRDAAVRAVFSWCLEARRSRGLAGFSLTDIVVPGSIPPGSFRVSLYWGRHETAEIFAAGCTPDAALLRLELADVEARKSTEEHARRNPGISRVLDWRPGGVTNRAISYPTLDPLQVGIWSVVRWPGIDPP